MATLHERYEQINIHIANAIADTRRLTFDADTNGIETLSLQYVENLLQIVQHHLGDFNDACIGGTIAYNGNDERERYLRDVGDADCGRCS